MTPYKVRPTCNDASCASLAWAQGLCRRHHRIAVLEGLQPRVTPSRAERFWAKVAIRDTDDCWPWQAKVSIQGYGHFDDNGAHRTSYELAKGPIPEGLVIDHLCQNRRCVNPNHLEAVPHATNVRRGYAPSVAVAAKKEIARTRTHCLNGHELTAQNTYVIKNHPLRRRCRICAAAGKRRRRARAS